MKKILYGIICFSLGIIFSVCAGIIYSANDITYLTINNNKVSNVQEALDDLYSNPKITILKKDVHAYSSTTTSHGSKTYYKIDIKDDYENYQNITISNIDLGVDRFNVVKDSSGNVLGYKYDISDYSNGVITIMQTCYWASNYYGSIVSDLTIIITE